MAEHALMQVDGHQSNMMVAHHPLMMVHDDGSSHGFTHGFHDGRSLKSVMTVHRSRSWIHTCWFMIHMYIIRCHPHHGITPPN